MARRFAGKYFEAETPRLERRRTPPSSLAMFLWRRAEASPRASITAASSASGADNEPRAGLRDLIDLDLVSEHRAGADHGPCR